MPQGSKMIYLKYAERKTPSTRNYISGKKKSIIEEKLLPSATSKIKEGFLKNIHESQKNKK